MRSAIGVVILVLCLAAAADPQDKPRKDTAVEPTSWGWVIGQVYDASTGAPVEGAAVSIRQDGAFADTGRTAGKTDRVGRYRCAAIIGRTSENFDIGRALLSSPLGILFGGATNRTKRIDVTRAAVRVTHEGYKPFEGVVVCRTIQPEKFSITLQPILLAPTAAPDVSTAAEGWGVARIRSVSIDPPVLKPGAKATVTVLVQSPPVVNLRDVRVGSQFVLDGRLQTLWLKPHGNAADGILTFTSDFAVPARVLPSVGDLVAVMTDCPYDVIDRGERDYALLQIATTPAGETTGATRSEAYRLMRIGDNAAAAALLKKISGETDASIWDFEQLGRLCARLHDNAGATDAWKHAVDLTPEKPESARLIRAGRYAFALVSNGEAATAVAQYAPVVGSVKEADRPKRIPANLMVALGDAYLQQGDLEQAQKISEALLKWQDSDLLPATGQFRNALRLAQAQAKVKADPSSGAAHADYGRVLMDQGRWEEAIVELQTAQKASPDLPAIQRDLGYAVLHVRGDAGGAPQNLDEALGAAENATQITDSKGKPAPTKDFFAWHAYGMLLYSKAAAQQRAQDPGAVATFARCTDALRTALKCARSGARVNPGVYAGQFGYASGSLVAIAGFAYSQADSDFVVLDSLRELGAHPDDYVAEFNLGTALLDLRQPVLAADPLKRALELKPEFVEAKYASAILALQQGDHDAAMAQLKEVLRLNPRHSRANLVLAKLYAEDGDTAAAAACLAAHARYYGSTQ